MYCGNCGAELTEQTNFCPYCGSRLQNATPSMSLYNKASSAARSTNVYNLVLVSTGTLDRISAGDLLEDVFGYTDEESSNLISMMPVVVGENLTSQEATTVAQMFTEYGMEVSITDKEDKYVDLTGNAKTSVFDSAGKLLSSAAAIIGALTVANRITTYRRYKRPSLIERLFRIAYKPYPPVYRRYFRPYIVAPKPAPPRRTIRKPAPIHRTPMMSPGPNGHNRLNGLGPGVANAQRKPGNPTGNRHPGNPGGNKGPGGKGGPGRKH